MYGCWDMEHDRSMEHERAWWHDRMVILDQLLPFYHSPLTTHKIKILKKWRKKKKKHLEISSFTQVCHKWQSYNVCFLRYKVWKTELIKILKKLENCLEILSFYTCVPKIMIIWCIVPEIWSMTEIFSHFGLFFALIPP